MAGLYEAPSLSTMKIAQFKGIDVSSSEDQIQSYRAAWSENMMPDGNGEVRKRPGVRKESGGITNTMLGSSDERVIDTIGSYLAVFKKDTGEEPEYTLQMKLENSVGSTDSISVAKCSARPVGIRSGAKWFVFISGCSSIYRADQGTHYESAVLLVMEGAEGVLYTDLGKRCKTKNLNGISVFTEIGADDENLTVPIVLNGCRPEGGGNPYQQINLLNPWATESFCWKDGAKVLYMMGETDAPDVLSASDGTMGNYFSVEVLTQEDETDENNVTGSKLYWKEHTFAGNDAYRKSYNRIYIEEEKIALPEGEDNIRVSYRWADFKAQFQTLCGCVCGTTFGVGGHKDRLFIGGGALGTRVYYSELEDPFYIGDLNFIELTAGEVAAIDGTADTLAIITDEGIYMAQASAQDTTGDAGYVSDALFTLSGKIPAPAPKENGNTAILGGEIVYLSREGVIAVAYEENFSARYAEHRSALIDRQMLKDDPQQLISMGRYLLVRCKDGVCWLLDENQPTSEGNKPYSHHQYEGFRLTGMYMDHAQYDGERLWIYYAGGLFSWTAGTLATDYHDEYGAEATAIKAQWETPWLYGSTFYRKKIFMKLGVLLGQLEGMDTAIKVEGRKNEEDWKTLWEYDPSLFSFRYSALKYGFFTYKPKADCPDLAKKIKVKKAMRFKLRFTNEFFNQPFILRNFGLDYVQED